MCNLLSVDGVNDPEVLSINAASAALAVSDIPWNGPVGAVRVGLIDGEVVTNPSRKEMSQSALNLVVSATHRNLVVMLEAAAENVYTQDFLKVISFVAALIYKIIFLHFLQAIKVGVKECQIVVQAIDEVRKKAGKVKREFVKPSTGSDELYSALKIMCENRLRDILRDFTHDKISRDVAVSTVRNSVIENFRVSFPETDSSTVMETFNKVFKDLFRNLILEEEIR